VPSPDAVIIDANGVDSLITSLGSQGYRVMGPVVVNGAIVHREVQSAEEIPVGWHDSQQPGSYRLKRTDDDEAFGWAVGPESFKQSVFPSSAVLWRARRDGQDVTVEPAVDDARPEAFFGARPCEVAALDVLGGVLAGASRPDPLFTRRRGAKPMSFPPKNSKPTTHNSFEFHTPKNQFFQRNNPAPELVRTLKSLEIPISNTVLDIKSAPSKTWAHDAFDPPV